MISTDVHTIEFCNIHDFWPRKSLSDWLLVERILDRVYSSSESQLNRSRDSSKCIIFLEKELCSRDITAILDLY